MNHFDTHLMLEYHRQRLHEAMADAQNYKMTRQATLKPIRSGFWIIAILCLLVLLTSACNVTVTPPDLTPVVVDVQVEEATHIPTVNSAPTLVPTFVPTLVPTLIPTTVPDSQSPSSCAAHWFFTFDAQHQVLAAFCPEPGKLSITHHTY